MTPADPVAIVRGALNKPMLSKEDCLAVWVAVRHALTNPTDAMKEAFSDAEDSNDHPVEHYLNTRRLGAMIDALLAESRG